MNKLSVFLVMMSFVFMFGCGGSDGNGSGRSSGASVCSYGQYECQGNDSYFCGYSGNNLLWLHAESCSDSCDYSTGKCSGSGGGSGNGSGNGGGNSEDQTLVGADIFKAFDKVGNQFWYQWYLSGSYVGYKRKTYHYKSASCHGWEVVDVNGDTATVNIYRDFDFDNPDIRTFSRGADGSLFMDGKQVTNTQNPEFTVSFGKKGSYVWQELYSDGEYTNIFYTTSDGYTQPDNTIDIREVWNEFGFAGNQETDFSNADAGSSTSTMTLKRAETAYVSIGNDLGNISGVNITSLEDITSDSQGYIQENPTAMTISVEFTHNNTNTWGYGIGVWMNGSKGDAWYPFFAISDIHDMVKIYEKHGASDNLGQAITDFDETKHYYRFFLTPKVIELGENWEQISFCIFALGFGPDYISTIDEKTAAFTIDFTKSETPATRRITNRSALKPAPLRLNDRIPAHLK